MRNMRINGFKRDGRSKAVVFDCFQIIPVASRRSLHLLSRLRSWTSFNRSNSSGSHRRHHCPLCSPSCSLAGAFPFAEVCWSVSAQAGEAWVQAAWIGSVGFDEVDMEDIELTMSRGHDGGLFGSQVLDLEDKPAETRSVVGKPAVALPIALRLTPAHTGRLCRERHKSPSLLMGRAQVLWKKWKEVDHGISDG